MTASKSGSPMARTVLNLGPSRTPSNCDASRGLAGAASACDEAPSTTEAFATAGSCLATSATPASKVAFRSGETPLHQIAGAPSQQRAQLWHATEPHREHTMHTSSFTRLAMAHPRGHASCGVNTPASCGIDPPAFTPSSATRSTSPAPPWVSIIIIIIASPTFEASPPTCPSVPTRCSAAAKNAKAPWRTASATGCGRATRGCDSSCGVCPLH
mmetsp:Transcript_168685/g.542051  ORF Transcript_168685/g.542051 Transcript_168685/m.542051 type:complete len:214 (+) Transcript_168685:506-1147(+)